MLFTLAFKQCRFSSRRRGFMSWVMTGLLSFKNKKARGGYPRHNTIINSLKSLIIMHTKTTLSKPFHQDFTTCENLPESTVEFFAIRKNMTVMFFQNGVCKNWNQLHPQLFVLMANAYRKDAGAKDYLRQWNLPFERQVELFTYFGWGTLDHQPDILNGVLQPCENFRHSPDCPSVQFDTKQFTINRQPLTKRDLQIIDVSAKGLSNHMAAEELSIHISTYNSQKADLFKKTKTDNVVSLVMAAAKEKLIAS